MEGYKFTRFALLALACSLSLATLTSASTNEFNDPFSPVYGNDHLHPAPDSLLGKYIAETGAATLPRSFSINGVPGPERLVVAVSETSFPILAQYFSDRTFLHFFHEPLTHMVQVAYEGKRGSMARLPDDFRYTQSGVDLLPICLTQVEAHRTQLYFELAANTPRRFDVANFPWLLLSANGKPYTTPGNAQSLSEWFARMPIGEDFDASEVHEQYVLNNLSDAAKKIVTEVWSVPQSHLALAQLLNLTPYDARRGFNTPGLIAISLLASASVERLPVFFRFVYDHTEPLRPDFDPWLDLDFDPAQPLGDAHVDL